MNGFIFTIGFSSLFISIGLLFAWIIYLASREPKEEGAKSCDGGLH